MKTVLKYFFAFLIFSFTATFAHAMFPNDDIGSALRTKANVSSPLEGLGTVVHRTKNLMVAVYDVSVLGGAVGDINLLDDYGNSAVLPKGAIVTNVVSDTLATGVSAGGGLIALKLLATADLHAATAAASMDSTSPFKAGVPVGTAATWKGPVTATAGTAIKASITSADVTAGKIKYFVEYVIQ